MPPQRASGRVLAPCVRKSYDVRMQARPTYLSEAAFLALPPSDRKVELLDGEVVVSPSVTWEHQDRVRRLFLALSAWAQRSGGSWDVCFAPLDVRFGDDRILQPDLFVLRAPPSRPVQMPLREVPVLCVEVLSSDTAYDRHAKRFVYAGAGVHEYWVVDPGGGLEVFTGPGLRTRAEVPPGGVLHSTVLPGCALSWTDVFPG